MNSGQIEINNQTEIINHPEFNKQTSQNKKPIIIITVVLLLVLGVGGYFLYSGKDNSAAHFELLKKTENKIGDNYNLTNETNISYTDDGEFYEARILLEGKYSSDIQYTIVKEYLNTELNKTTERYTSIADDLIKYYTKENSQNWQSSEVERVLTNEEAIFSVFEKYGKIKKGKKEIVGEKDEVIPFEITIPFKHAEEIVKSAGLDTEQYTFNKEKDIKFTYYYNVEKEMIYNYSIDLTGAVEKYQDNACSKLTFITEVSDLGMVAIFEIPKTITEVDHNEGLSGKEILEKMTVPVNAHMTYRGDIKVTVDKQAASIIMNVRKQTNELLQTYFTTRITINSTTLLDMRSYGFVEGDKAIVYVNEIGDTKWYKATDNLPSNRVEDVFGKKLSQYGKVERKANTRVDGVVMNVIRVDIPFNQFKEFLVQEPSEMEVKFNNSKTVTVTLYINSMTNIVNKYDINYNDSATSYSGYPITSYTEVVEYSGVGTVKEIKLPAEVLENLAS